MTSSSILARSLHSVFDFDFWGNSTKNTTDFDANLEKPEDVSVDAVWTSLHFNTIIFVVLMASYELLRRILPAVYSNSKRLDFVRPDPNQRETEDHTRDGTSAPHLKQEEFDLHKTSLTDLPDDAPLDWVFTVLAVPWTQVRRTAGLDGYFFLRYIRMNIRITAVSTFWFSVILVPIYATGENSAQGWYHFSAANLNISGWRMWFPIIFSYLFTAFIIFVIKQEYRHFLELRQDFLARGRAHVQPQRHYSLLVENVPYELRSDRALKEYFDRLFPGKVHSASVVLNLPDSEEKSSRCLRTCRRLEKSIAYLYATGKRPTHIVGRGRFSVLGVDLEPLDCNCTASQDAVFIEDDIRAEKPRKGTRVDDISYYTQELAAHSRNLSRMQQQKSQIARSGNMSIKADNWFDKVVREASAVADQIMGDSMLHNALVSPTDSFSGGSILQAETMTSQYGTISPAIMSDRQTYGTLSDDDPQCRGKDDLSTRLMTQDHLDGSDRSDYADPFERDQYRGTLRRWAGRLGLDFAITILRYLNKQLDVSLENVLGATMSSSGFVSFFPLSSTTCAACAPLTAKASVLDVAVAPGPREILWQNAHVSKAIQERRENTANSVLALGAILWSFPLAAIQLFAKAEFVAQIPGMGWVLTFHGGTLWNFVNGYLPVVALLGLILVLPLIFEYIAVYYERRKTFSDVQASMLGRYFYYQLANIYVSVTSGSILKSLTGVIDHPSNVLILFGESLPTMVGYFVALLTTKILAGLPMVLLRFGPLSRMIFLKTLSNQKKLTQRELDAVYRLENVEYGWEFPTQLLVVVIVFTYAIICPVILPVGCLYFLGALMVYKKQVLYIYSPVYESGGSMFPVAVQRTLVGLVCGQMTFLGYLVTRGSYYFPLFLFPLPLVTIFVLKNFEKTYVEPSTKLSLERARQYDRMSDLQAASAEGLSGSEAGGRGVELRRRAFDRDFYRQPVLTELAAEPMTYRRGYNDEETVKVRDQLKRINQYVMQAGERVADADAAF